MLGPHLSPVGGQTTLGQDDRQRTEAERVRELGVVERDRERSAFTQQDADEEVDEQRRQSDARGEPYGEDRRQRHDRPDQHEHVELVDVERHADLVLFVCGGRARPRSYRSGEPSDVVPASPAACRPAPARQRRWREWAAEQRLGATLIG